MDVRYTVGRNEYKRMTTDELRGAFMIDLFEGGKTEPALLRGRTRHCGRSLS